MLSDGQETEICKHHIIRQIRFSIKGITAPCLALVEYKQNVYLAMSLKVDFKK